MFRVLARVYLLTAAVRARLPPLGKGTHGAVGARLWRSGPEFNVHRLPRSLSGPATCYWSALAAALALFRIPCSLLPSCQSPHLQHPHISTLSLSHSYMYCFPAVNIIRMYACSIWSKSGLSYQCDNPKPKSCCLRRPLGAL
jgi:hypothetical protein